MKERVLITGASGFIGYHLVEEALKNNFDVYAAIRRSSNIEHLKNFNIKYTYPDFADVSLLKKELKENKYDYIIHAAGATKARSQKEYDHINAGYTQNLAQAVLESGIRLKKFVFIGSLAGVGPLNNLTGIITEGTIPSPITAYGKSKLLAEEYLKAFTSLNYNILRPTGVYGPRDRDIFIFFKQVARGFEPYIGNIEQKFSFLYVTDLAKAAIRALFTANQKTYILSDGNFYGRYELGSYIKEGLSSKTIKLHLPVKFVKLIAKASEKYSSLSNKASVLNVEKINELMAVNWFCSIENARADLGFYPEYNLKTGVTETLKWYKANKWL
jgi:UDP-glucose 4-epimerase